MKLIFNDAHYIYTWVQEMMPLFSADFTVYFVNTTGYFSQSNKNKCGKIRSLDWHCVIVRKNEYIDELHLNNIDNVKLLNCECH